MALKVAIVGRPNVGKSTLVNRILGEERMIASDVPGTTRDSIAVDLERDGRRYRLIDTAGLRRKSKVDEAVEKFSIIKTLQAIEQCQVAVGCAHPERGRQSVCTTHFDHRHDPASAKTRCLGFLD